MVVPEIAPTPSARANVESARRPRVFSGIQPTGNLHLGNYLGAIRNWVIQQEQYDCVFCIVDLHALGLPMSRDQLRRNILDLANVLLASGIDPAHAVLFSQSDVREHAELCWLLTASTQFGELRRMTQFKDKSGGHDEAVSAAVFIYPVLQAADILLYDAEFVPVGEDQRQHVELTRDVAARFNARYGQTFVVPTPDIKAAGARIMALDDPTKKMSKSAANPGGSISFADDADAIRRKIKRAVTDSGSDVTAGPDKPALTNLLTIYAICVDSTVAEIEERYLGKGYGAFKSDLAEVLIATLGPIQRRLAELEAEPNIGHGVLVDGANRARAIAAAKMELVRDRIGIGAG